MKKIIILVLLFSSSLIFANHFELLSFKEVANDFTASKNPVYDDNMQYCVALYIENKDVKKAEFDEKMFKTGMKKGVRYYFFSSDELFFNVKVNGYEPVKIDIKKELGEPLMMGKTYRLHLKTIKEVFAELNVEPKDALIILDDKVVQNNARVSLLPGKHQLKVLKDGYISESKNFEIQNGTYFVDLKLEKKEATKQEAIIVEKIVEKVVEKEPIQDKQPKNTENPIFEENGIRFELTSIEMINDKIYIKGSITNLEDDRNIVLIGSTYLFDNLGSKYEVTTQQLGTFETKYNNRITGELIQDLSIPYTMEFRKIKGNPTSLPKLNIVYQIERQNYNAVFKKLSL